MRNHWARSDRPWPPGPWQQCGTKWLIVADDPRRPAYARKVASTFCGVRCGNTDHAEADADAALIRLAPEMAEAILWVSQYINATGGRTDAQASMVKKGLGNHCWSFVEGVAGRLRQVGETDEG